MPLPFPSPFSFVFVFVLFLFSSLSLLVDCPSANQQTEGQVYSEPVHPPLPTPPTLMPLLAPLPAQDQPHPCSPGPPPSIPLALPVLAFPLTPTRASGPFPRPSPQSGPQCVLRAQGPSSCSVLPPCRPCPPFSVPPRQLNSGDRAGCLCAASHPAAPGPRCRGRSVLRGTDVRLLGKGQPQGLPLG